MAVAAWFAAAPGLSAVTAASFAELANCAPVAAGVRPSLAAAVFDLPATLTATSGWMPAPLMAWPLGVYHLAVVRRMPTLVVGQREDALDGALAVAFFADDRAAAMIADRARQNLAGAGRIMIDEHDQRHPPGAGDFAAMIEIFARAAAARWRRSGRHRQTCRPHRRPLSTGRPDCRAGR